MSIMALSIPEAARQNDRAIAAALRARAELDSALAKVLWENYANGWYRLFGFRSLPEYLRERFKGAEEDRLARMQSKSVQRLIRDYRLAMEIPPLREAFDRIPRANRRLIAQVITAENAGEWVGKAERLTYRELEQAVGDYQDETQTRPVVKRFVLPQGPREVYQQALEVAGRLLAADGADPEVAEFQKLEMICQEFLATYGDGYRAFTVTECPACENVAGLQRRPDEDEVDRVGKRVAFKCSQCGASVVLAVRSV